MNAQRILEIQATTGRTSDGIEFGQELLDVVKNSLANPEIGEVDMMQCWNCKFVLDGERFAMGCPACGCKDFDSVSNPQQAVLKED